MWNKASGGGDWWPEWRDERPGGEWPQWRIMALEPIIANPDFFDTDLRFSYVVLPQKRAVT
jgi:hypothetical protein